MRKYTAVAASIVVIACVGAGAYWAGSQGSTAATSGAKAPAKPATAPPAVLVEAAPVRVEKLPRAITTVGSLRSDETVVVRPEVPGRVARIGFEEGERVAAGSVLLALDDSVQRADLARA